MQHPPFSGVPTITGRCPHTVVVSRDGTAEFCKLAFAHMSRRGSEARSLPVGSLAKPQDDCGAVSCTVLEQHPTQPTHTEVEYRVKVHDAGVWNRFVQCLRLVPDAVTQLRVYSVLSFPADVRATLLKHGTGTATGTGTGTATATLGTEEEEEGTTRGTAALETGGNDATALRLEQKTSLLRMRIGTVQSCPIWGVVAMERPLTDKEAVPYVHAVRELVEGDVDLSRAALSPPLTKEWLRMASMDLRFKRGRQGARDRYLSCPGYVCGQHVAFGSVRVPSRANAATAPVFGASTAWRTPVSVRECTRTSFQWDPLFRVDCTVMSVNGADATYHVEVECCGDKPVPFPRQVEDLLRQQLDAPTIQSTQKSMPVRGCRI